MKVGRSRKIFRKILWALGILAILFTGAVAIVYSQQDRIVQELLSKANEDFRGHVVIQGSHISPFVNFPYVSIDLEGLEIYEEKEHLHKPVLALEDVYIGIDLGSLLSGNFEIRAIQLEKGHIDVVQYLDGSLNISKAFEPLKPVEDTGEEFHLDLKKIKLREVELTKFNEENQLLFDLIVEEALSRFKTDSIHISAGLEMTALFTLVKDGKQSFIHDKHIKINTAFEFIHAEQVLRIEPSTIRLEKAEFAMNGSVDMDDNANLNLDFSGEKDDFELLIAFAPEELIPTLEKYSNQGEIYFKASVKGPCINGHDPRLDAEFGCKDGFFSNTLTQRKLDEMQFNGYFTTGADGRPASMEFGLKSFSARPEAGIFSGSLLVKNFESPDIDLSLDSDFNLDFLAKFLNVEELQDLKGHVLLKMNFHDIIDLERPELSIERLNESYFTELKVTDLGFRSPDFHLPVEDIDLNIEMDGHAAQISHFSMKVGKSDLQISGSIDDLPAILHHTAIPVNANLDIRASRLDLRELSQFDDSLQQGVDEVLRDLEIKLHFLASAKAFTEFKNLPVGEFFIDDLHVSLEKYPHRLHDFHADILINDEDFSIVDFSGEVDDSDFHFSGKLANYDMWFEEKPQGDTRVEFDLVSAQIRLEDLFSYGGENHVPEDYRHEVFQELKLHGHSELHFKDSLHSADIYLDKMEARMKAHPLKLEDFGGRFHLEGHLMDVTNFRGRMGHSNFRIDLHTDLHKLESGSVHSNWLKIRSDRLDLDQLLAWSAGEELSGAAHDSVFSVFDLSFPNLRVELDIAEFNYHNYRIRNVGGELECSRDHVIRAKSLRLDMAGGHLDLNATFDGRDRSAIYVDPEMSFQNLDIDQLLIKFDNFGQDELVAENLHGRISGSLNGKIHVHADLVPVIEDSEIHLDLEVTNGRLDDYEPMLALADYFQDKNLNRVSFDTLSNHIDMKNGVLQIPRMTVNSSLGHLEISGEQDMDLNMNYIIRVPWKMITRAGSQKLFGVKDKAEAEQEDAIEYADPEKRVRYVNVQLTGTPEEFSIKLVGKKKATSR